MSHNRVLFTLAITCILVLNCLDHLKQAAVHLLIRIQEYPSPSPFSLSLPPSLPPSLSCNMHACICTYILAYVWLIFFSQFWKNYTLWSSLIYLQVPSQWWSMFFIVTDPFHLLFDHIWHTWDKKQYTALLLSCETECLLSEFSS